MAIVAALLAGTPVKSSGSARTKTIVLETIATRAGDYLYLPFRVPRGVYRIDAKVEKEGAAETGVGLFDWRGAGYQSPGFRGIYGAERDSFFVTARDASLAFTPGRMHRGRWTIIIPVFTLATPTRVKVTVRLSFGPKARPLGLGRASRPVNSRAGWYGGDLHAHTVTSSDAFASGSALTARGWARKARASGLDFISLTDHNVVSQNFRLRGKGVRGVLLIGGEEMTNWFHGHATVTGLSPGEWLDWRQVPAGAPTGTGQARIQRFLRVARRLGTYTAAAHPFGAHLSWQFFADAEADPAALPDGLEVWNGPWQPDDDATLQKWDELLQQGHRIAVNGGSDTHGIDNTSGTAPGYPTTVVYARSLSTASVVASLRRGRAFITRTPRGPRVYLAARGADGIKRRVGGTVRGAAGDTAKVSVIVRRGTGFRLVLLRDGTEFQTVPITESRQRVVVDQPIGAGGYVRAELRGVPVPDPENPAASRGDMEALTNPIYLRQE